MNKKELISEVARRTGLTQAKAGEVVDAIFAKALESLGDGEDVSIPGFGRWMVRQRPARTGRHPRTGAPLDIPAFSSVRFAPAKQMKEELTGTRNSALAGDPVTRAPGLPGRPVTPAPGLPSDPITSAPGTGGGSSRGRRR